jgi:telomere length regulation protein
MDDSEPASEPVRTSRPSVVLSDGHDSDDSLTGYASQSSSRSPSPSELAEIERDPTLRVGRTKVSPPVYLAQLGEMIRGPSGLKTDQENQEAERIEIALDVAEELIRRRRGYGTELGRSLASPILLSRSFTFNRGEFSQSRLRSCRPP